MDVRAIDALIQAKPFNMLTNLSTANARRRWFVSVAQ